MSKKYSKAMKSELVSRYYQGVKVKKLCEEHGVSKTSLYSWIKLFSWAKNTDGNLVTAKDFYDLQKEYCKMKTDFRALQDCNCAVNADLNFKLEAIAEHDGKFPIHSLCRVLGVRRSTYYHHKLRRPEKTQVEIQDEILKPVIKEVFEKTKGRIGSKKICYLMRNQGYSNSAVRVRRLMKELGLACRAKIKRANYNYSKSSLYCKDLVKQNFDQSEPNKVWVSDITYVRVNRKAYYLCVMIDLFSRKVIGYKVKDNQETPLVIETFTQAYEKRGPNSGLILHSDQGNQYRSNSFRKLIRKKGFESSFSRAGCPYDNAVAESFFRMFKQEEANHIYYRIAEELEASVDEYIHFFNDERPHDRLGNLTPNEKEEQYYKSLT